MEVDDPGPGEVDPGPENIQEDMETEEPVSNKEVLGKTQIDSIAEHKFQFLSYKAAPIWTWLTLSSLNIERLETAFLQSCGKDQYKLFVFTRRFHLIAIF